MHWSNSGTMVVGVTNQYVIGFETHSMIWVPSLTCQMAQDLEMRLVRFLEENQILVFC